MILLLRVSKVCLVILAFGNVYPSIGTTIDPVNGSHQNESVRILGGETSVEEAWPFMAAIFTWEKNEAGNFTWRHTCGGTVWNEETILTAAHCLVEVKSSKKIVPIPVNRLFVYLGHTYIKSHRDQSYVFNVRSTRRHPGFIGVTNDIGILKLEEKIDIKGKHSKAGCVCEPEKNLAKLRTVNCIALGWGYTEPWEAGVSGSLPERLQQVEINIQPLKSPACRRHPMYREEEHICAGITGKGSCQYDSGGPLLCPLKDRQPTVYSLVGITSFGDPKCKEGPSFFTPVTPYIDWIDADRGESEPKPVSGIFDGPLFYIFIFAISVAVVALICMLLLRLVVCAAILVAILAIVLIIAKLKFSA